MSDKTGISWTDSTFNPWMGCTKVGPGCDHCYAERDMDHRYGRVIWGPGNPRVRTKPANWQKPIRWNGTEFFECEDCGHRSEGIVHSSFVQGGWAGSEIHCPECHSSNMELVSRRVFCASLADVFDNEVDAQWREDLFQVIEDTPNLDWLILTKRIGNVAAMTADKWPERLPENVWLGITVVNQLEADRDIPKLLNVKANIHWLSMEPLLEDVDLGWCSWCGNFGEHDCYGSDGDSFIDWVVVGGESGPGFRNFDAAWARSLRDQCADAGVRFFMKQMSGSHKRTMTEIPEDLMIRQFPDG